MNNPIWIGRTLNRRALLGGTGAAVIGLDRFHRGAGAAPASIQTATPVRGGTLRVGVQGDPVGLDPHLSVLDAADIVLEFIYEGLATFGANLEPRPGAASEWSISDDGLVYTFLLQNDLRFHNGRAVTSADV